MGKNALFLVQLCVSHHMVLRWLTFQSFSEHFEHRKLNLMVIEAEIQMPNKIGDIFLKSPHPSGRGLLLLQHSCLAHHMRRILLCVAVNLPTELLS